MNKVAYIIPGLGESHLKQTGYKKIGRAFEERGIKAVQVKIKWKYKKPIPFSTYIEQFLKQYKKVKNQDVYFLGFSFGAIIALAGAAKLKPKVLILCSLSPYFTEDLKTLNPEWVRWYRKYYTTSYAFKDLGPLISSKTYLLEGSKEIVFPKRKFKNSKKIIAPGAKHIISSRPYIKTVLELIAKL